MLCAFICLSVTALNSTPRLAATRRSFVGLSTLPIILLTNPNIATAKLEGVNKPELLPQESNKLVIQTEKFLTTSQQSRLETVLKLLEKDTGFRVRVLCQRYPQTPGLAIRDYWKLGEEAGGDNKVIVMVVDEFGGKVSLTQSSRAEPSHYLTNFTTFIRGTL